MPNRDLDKTCLKFSPGLWQVGFSHNFLCLLSKSWRKSIKCRELFWKNWRKSSFRMNFTLVCQLQQALEGWFSSILKPNLLEVLYEGQKASNLLVRPWSQVEVTTYRSKCYKFFLENWKNLHHFDEFFTTYQDSTI